MTVYIDSPDWPGHGRLWAHMVSDTSYDELHDFASALGIPRRAPVLRIVRLYRDTDDRVVEASVSIHPGDRFTYSMQIDQG